MTVTKTSVLILFVITLTLSLPAEAHLKLVQDPQSSTQALAPQDPITQLRLTPEQRQKIRIIREQNKEERGAINQRLRESNLALEQTLDSENPNEAEIDQRLRDLAAAQAASTRMRVMTELRIRRVLTPEQIGMWRALRKQAAEQRRQQTSENPNRPGQAVDAVHPNQRKGITPLFPRRDLPRRNPRP